MATAEFMRRIAAAAARETLPRFRASGAVANKLEGGFDPVTEADREAERAIRALIGAEFPDDGILGEEHGLAAAIINVASVEQAGFPRRAGGALRFIAGIGTQAFLARADALARRFGAPFHIDIAADDAARLLSDAESRNHQGETE